MDESTKLKLLAGLSLKFSNIEIKPLTLIQIADIGYKQYNLYLMNLIAEPKDFNLVEGIDINSITTWDIILSNMYHGTDEYREFLINAMELFVQDKVTFVYCKGYFYVGNIKDNKIINKDNFEEFKRILKIQNCLDKEKKEEKFANKKAEEIMKKIMKGRQSIKNNSEKVEFSDLVSVLAANGNGLNILNVWDLTMYKFNDQFARMQMIEEYDINIRSLLAGANSNEIKLKHYIRSIDIE